MFTGQKPRTMDSKGRIPVPAEFRHELGESVWVVEGLWGALVVFTNDGFNEFLKELKGDPIDPDLMALKYQYAATAEQVKIDSAGRIRITEAQIDAANLTREVMMVGMIDQIHIWDKEAWLAHKKASDYEKNARDMAARRALTAQAAATQARR
ncbi:MAG: hypothetical protein LBS17_06505 [Actinomycetes bacterium]|jgi:MraZ protein|nr:hypothetical protein [Actinomycetes bacterium]